MTMKSKMIVIEREIGEMLARAMRAMIEAMMIFQTRS